MPPRVAVIGSCITRDPFSRKFVPTYKDRVELVAYVYQTAFPSLVRTERIHVDGLPAAVLPHHVRYIEQELQGDVLNGLISSKPDIVVVDLYADVHFGVTTFAGLLTTRNHMAFSSSEAATAFFKDEGQLALFRLRFDGEEVYRRLIKRSLEIFIGRLKESLPGVRLVLNSARFADGYLDHDSDLRPFANSERLNQKNNLWNEVDELFVNMTDCLRISYPKEVLVGSVLNPWGLNPVHYTEIYYEYFWNEMARIFNV